MQKRCRVEVENAGSVSLTDLMQNLENLPGSDVGEMDQSVIWCSKKQITQRWIGRGTEKPSELIREGCQCYKYVEMIGALEVREIDRPASPLIIQEMLQV